MQLVALGELRGHLPRSRLEQRGVRALEGGALFRVLGKGARALFRVLGKGARALLGVLREGRGERLLGTFDPLGGGGQCLRVSTVARGQGLGVEAVALGEGLLAETVARGEGVRVRAVMRGEGLGVEAIALGERSGGRLRRARGLLGARPRALLGDCRELRLECLGRPGRLVLVLGQRAVARGELARVGSRGLGALRGARPRQL
ncbi:MAG TPA: hypothetical protein VLT33_50420, partial [Labilithrix sp.]|nr:hypothetical protein [Labilithrix sp.]